MQHVCVIYILNTLDTQWHLFLFATYRVDSFDSWENVLFDKTVKWLLLKSLKKKKKNQM